MGGWRRAWLAVLVLLAVAGCTGGVAPTPTAEPPSAAVSQAPSPSPTPETSDEPIPSPTTAPSPTEATLPADLDPEIAAAIEWRRSMGLRTDVDWVTAVMANPDAMTAWAYPILAEEQDWIFARQERMGSYGEAVVAYGKAHEDVFGGMYLDNARSLLVTLWTDDPAVHLAAMRAVAGADAPIEARQVRWSQATLWAVQERLDPDWPGFAAAQATSTGWGASTTDNVLEVEISSANPDAPRLIADALARELAVPVEMLRVISDGTGVELLGRGRVKGIVIVAGGSRPRSGWSIDGDPVTIGYCGGGDIGYGIGRDGEFEIPCKEGDYRMQVVVYRDGHQVVLGESAVITVRAGQTTTGVRIRIGD